MDDDSSSSSSDSEVSNPDQDSSIDDPAANGQLTLGKVVRGRRKGKSVPKDQEMEGDSEGVF